ncbi:bifunctional Endonuclease-exonuclease-phosphatase superfamily/Endonuclease-exonuclease-phosphatase/SAC domain/Inositol polyphosphate-related phosphatase [Babesia duncani]|uniref:phosphoinositide 5-phosphatase n=1 Tax=Babesia duncani TaxID=323732 RepID=A0AAD9PNM0_9APIC|nr:bifunctional Endonuclease-exonuclease-phosphatase superfamily/Endonuclease-exonuclease-phosphatase/SAC domain/Inositol polyphosphate-related phosphatase [Babesia duncani]
MPFTLCCYNEWLSVESKQGADASLDTLGVVLWVNRESGDIKESSEPLVTEQPLIKIDIEAVLGTVKYLGTPYLVVVTESELVVDIDFAAPYVCKPTKIYTIKTARCIPLNGNTPWMYNSEEWFQNETDDENQLKGMQVLNSVTQWFKTMISNDDIADAQTSDSTSSGIESVERTLCVGYYYTFDANLTWSLQRHCKHASNSGYTQSQIGSTNLNEASKLPHTQESIDTNFDWAFCMSRTLPERWALVLIQGYVGYTKCEYNDRLVELFLIGRRSTKRSGTRLNARGIDNEGNVGNFCESELRFRIDAGPWKSFTQIRGSVPVYWGQASITAPPLLSRSIQETSEAFMNHWKLLQEFGSKVYFFNLLSIRENELQLTHALESNIRLHPKMDIELINYNFNEHVKWESISTEGAYFVKERLGEAMKEIGHFDVESPNASYQRGIVRTNCLDCLDRTNVMQWTISWVWLLGLLQLHDLPLGDINMEDCILFTELRSLWCAHGDAISLHYAGTPSIFTTHIKQGKSTMSGYLHYGKTFAQRMFSLLIADGTRQRAFDIMLGRSCHHHLQSPRDTKILEAIPADLKIWCGTWNLGGHDGSTVDLEEWLGSVSNADLYCFCIQEFVDLTAFRVVMNINNESRQNNLNAHIANTLANLSGRGSVKYSRIASISMIGLYLVVFAKEELFPHIKAIAKTSVKTGLCGSTGNKGAVGVRFEILGHPICFLNVHLSSGKNPSQTRMDQLTHILYQAFSESGPRGSAWKHSLLLISGDFNFNIKMETGEILSRLRKSDLKSLLLHDEFYQNKAANIPVCTDLNEAKIKFAPTYKFVKGTLFYNTRRNPAWCDRILWYALANSKVYINPLQYTRQEHYTVSDHKPVSLLINAAFGKEETPLIDL